MHPGTRNKVLAAATTALPCYLMTLVLLVASGVSSRTVPCGGKPTDIVFVLDSSNSIWRPDFNRQLDFVNSVIDLFPIGDQNMKVGVISYSGDPYLWLHLNTYDNVEDIKAAVSDIYQDGGIHTYTDRAIQYMREVSFGPTSGARDGVTKIAIVITDGLSHDTEATEHQAKLAREEGIHMFSIGVGQGVDKLELDGIASEPATDYSYMVQDYSALTSVRVVLAITACTVTDKPTTPIPTTTAAPTTTTLRQPIILTPPPTPEMIHIGPDTTTSGPQEVYGKESISIPGFPAPHVDTGDLTWNPEHGPNRTPKGDGINGGGTGQMKPPGYNDVTKRGDWDWDPETGTWVLRREKKKKPKSRKRRTRKERRRIYQRRIKNFWRKKDECIPDEPTDLVFVVDSKTGGAQDQRQIWEYITKVVSRVNMAGGDMRLKIIRECLPVPAMQLNEETDTDAVLDRLSSMRGKVRKTPDLLHAMTEHLTQPDRLSENRRKVGIYITDGESGDLEGTIREAQEARLDHDIDLYGVGIGEHVNHTELKALVGCLVEEHLFQVPSHSKLKGLVKTLAMEMCRDDEYS